MEKIIVVCPSCRARLSFAPFPGYMEKLIKCSHCQFQAPVSGFLQGANARGASPNNDETRFQFNSPSPSSSTDMGQLRIIQSGQICPLKMGTNVIGRIAQTGTADIKVTKDPYMSRQHARIDVRESAGGIEHILYEINSTNIIKLNGKPISKGDIIILKTGDVMTMGKTDIRLEECNDEATQII